MIETLLAAGRIRYVKRAVSSPGAGDPRVRTTVEEMLRDIETGGEASVRALASRLDHWDAPFVLSDEKRARLIESVPRRARDDIRFVHEQVVRFAQAQRDSLQAFEIETMPGVRLGQRLIPVSSVGCYVPGGRYAHVASAIMSIATAKVAGAAFIAAASPPRGDAIDASVAFAMDLAGAELILEMGGVQAVAAMAFGLFGCPPADIIVGPGNAYVAEAKRALFGRVGIDVVAGPTESAIIADAKADPMAVAVDLVSQAEHGTDSPVWLFTISADVAARVAALAPEVAGDLPQPAVALAAWRDHGEILLAESREDLATASDHYAPEHLQVMAEETGWWLDRLRNYGSLFLGEGSTVTHGDKCAGTNHILPTRGAARYSGGLSVHKFLKVLTYQQVDPEANRELSAVASRISRMEGMEAHARACDWRLRKYFPGTSWDFPVYAQPRHH